MSAITFSNEEKAQIVSKIQTYFADQLDQELGGFDAEFLLDFFSVQVGPYFYNRGLYDARALLAAKLDALGDDIYALEQPTEFSK